MLRGAACLLLLIDNHQSETEVPQERSIAMSHAETNLTSVRRCFTALAVVIADFASTADAQAPQVGDVLFVPAITFSLQVGNTGKESKRARSAEHTSELQ